MQKLGKTDIEISTLGLGCMSISEFYGKSIEHSLGLDLIECAYNNGISLFDTADIYGRGKNEELLGDAVRHLVRQGFNRESLVIATKCGITRDALGPGRSGIDNSPGYIHKACNASIQRLGEAVKWIDLFYIHRVVNEEKVITCAMKAMAELLQKGCIRSVGLSEVGIDTIKIANDALKHYTDGGHQLAAVQTEYSLLTRSVERNGVLSLCQELGITFVAYSPLSRALLAGDVQKLQSLEKDDFRQVLPRFQPENMHYNLSIVEKVRLLAQQKECSVAQIALAWLMAKENVVPIPGTTKKNHLMDNVASQKVQLSLEEIKLLDHLPDPKGLRYEEQDMKIFGLEQEINV